MNLKRIVFIGAALLGVLIAVPLLIPMGAYLPQIEQMISEKIGVPVTIKSMHLAILPSPRAIVRGIVIGKDTDIRVDKVSAVLDIGSLFAPVKVVSSLEVQQPVVKKSAVALLSALASPGKKQTEAAPVTIRHIVVHNAKLEWDSMNLPAVDGEVDMDGEALQQARLTSTDGKLKVSAIPKDKGFDIELTAEKWTPPVGPALLLDSLNVDASLVGTHLSIPSFNARLYEGTVDGSAALDWTKLWKLSGKTKVAGLQVGKPAKLFSKTIQVSGAMTGNGTFSANAAKPEVLADHLTADFKFKVEHGVLHGMDLAKAASLFIKQGQSGGETEFDELSGILHASGRQYDLHDLQVVSGLLAANGGVRISPAKQLDGQVDVELKKGLALVTVPLQISGTTDAPEVMPTKAALAGATAGTAVLGPLGTALGMKAGSAMDRWFGGKK